jgi:GT2 family glycosyltransferase
MLAALGRQTYHNFDVVVVVKPSGDGTEEVLKASDLKITTVPQAEGHIVDAYFLGVKHSTGDIVAFLDDDAFPADDWLEETIKLFHHEGAEAVTGDSFPVLLKKNGEMRIIEEEEIPTVLSHYEFALFGRPLKGLEKYKNCIANSGVVYERGNNAYWRKRGSTRALLRGPSMAVSGRILRGINFPGEWILGCAWEMVLGWQLWRMGLKMVYTPKVKVYHVVHGRTSSRDFMKPRTDLLWAVEAELLFYRLYSREPEFSVISKIVSDIVRVVHALKYLRANPKYEISKLTGILIANIIGTKWLIYKEIQYPYSPVTELRKLQRTMKVGKK